MLKNYLKEKKEIFEIKLNTILEKYKYPDRLSKAMNYAVMNGGKRIRAVMMYMICDLFKKEYSNIEDIAVALEFIHCYSLVHDDLPAMDNDMYRRGKLTTHIKYDEATAILVGDVLLTEAFNIIANSKTIKSKNKIEIIKKISEYSGFYGMIGGQYVDMESEDIKINSDIENDKAKKILQYIHENKTGKLLTASIELPLIALDIKEYEKDKLIEYSKLLGIAFQIKDDILDIEGIFEKTGKKPTDEQNKKITYPSLYGLQESKELLKYYINSAKAIIEKDFKGYEKKDLFIEMADFFGNREV